MYRDGCVFFNDDGRKAEKIVLILMFFLQKNRNKKKQ